MKTQNDKKRAVRTFVARIGKLSNKKRFAAAAIVIVVACALLECFVFSNQYYFRNGAYTYYEVDLSEAGISGGASNYGDWISISGSGAEIYVRNIDLATSSVTIMTSCAYDVDAFPAECTIYLKDDAYADAYVKANSMTLSPAGSYTEQTVSVKSSGNLHALRLCFSASDTAYTIQSIRLNARVPFAFSWLRFVLLSLALCAVAAVAVFRLWRVVYDPFNPRHGMAVGLCALICVLIAIFVFIPIYNYNYGSGLYRDLVESLESGSLSISGDTTELEALDNPYDVSERNANYAVYRWDAAYYDGHYYVYFGIAPVLTVYLPFQAITGQLPSDGFVMFALAITLILSMFALLRELVIAFDIKPGLWVFMLVATACVFGTMVYESESTPVFYQIAALSGMAYLALCAALAWAARRAQGRVRALLFAACGAAAALVLMSRPQVLITAAAFMLPAFVDVLAKRGRKLRKKLADVACFALPAMAGAALVMWYNYARFGNPFDFGARYQLTVYDDRYLSLCLSPKTIILALSNYFAQIPPLKPTFPFVTYISSNTVNTRLGNYIYEATIHRGLLAIPLAWAALLIRPGLKHAPRIEKITLYAVFAAMLFIAVADYGLGGIHYRYTYDCAVALMAISACVIFALTSRHPENRTLRSIVTLACAATILMGFLYVFDNESDVIYDHAPDLYIAAKQFFSGFMY